MKKKLNILCPKCKEVLKINEKITCDKCSKTYSNKKNIFRLNNYKKEQTDYSKENKLFLDQIKKVGYKNAIKIFLEKFPQYKTQLINPEYNQSADHVFYCLNEKNRKCLVLENKFGNTVETLSHIYEEVISQNSRIDDLEIQSERFEKIENITLINSEVEKLNFPDNYFDTILIENIEKIIKNKDIFLIFKEILRILTPEGCFIFNNSKSHDQIKQILEKSNFITKQYWSMQKNQYPSFSGRIDDNIALRWYMKNVSNYLISKKISLQKKIMLRIMKSELNLATSILMKKFVPTIIFCCYKNNFSTSLLNLIQKETNYKNFVIQSRPKRIKIIILNRKGIPKKIINFNRFGYKFPLKIKVISRKFSKMNDPKERMWIEDWHEGNSINPEKIEHVNAAIDWLFKFQKETKQNVINKNEIKIEVNEIKKNIEKDKLLNFSDCLKWVDEYYQYIEENNFCETAIHGDYWINNIIINSKTSKISVIDWDEYKQKGLPFYDFMVFFIRLMTITKTSSLDTKKLEKFLDVKSDENKMMRNLKKKIDLHFNSNFNFLILLRMFIIKRMVSYDSSLSSEKQLKMLKLLSNKQELFL